MRQMPIRLFPLSVIAMALALFAAAGLIGGPGLVRDVFAIQSLAAVRTAHIGLANGAIMVTQLGSAEGLLAILLLAVALLAFARRRRDAVALVGIVIGGRVAIELLKLAIGRERPFFAPYPVDVHSLSFPSGHAGNSMITLLAIALIAASARWRGVAVASAVVASLVIGATRPFLGVHWPTDVIGGWAFGIAWVTALVALTRSWRGAVQQ